ILEKCRNILADRKKKVEGPLSGKTVLVTAGPTREYLDPVRFISNPSSGKMGFAMAAAARELGAEVLLIHGPVQLDPPAGVKAIEIESTSELFEQVREHASADVVIMAAAVSDFTPVEYREHKVKKSGRGTELKLKPTQDILSWLGDHRKNGQVLIGFAMETRSLIENANKKRKKKKIDWIVANSLNEPDAGFESDTNRVYLLGEESKTKIEGAKKEVARKILQKIFAEAVD
ncbi:MAG: phosphopantothenoylcysteine decarboxylase, partial [Balneolaceae bacterium]|nr:phosphopantothenoylcysteine decarboxylase [Balneolaceae bacterium]